MRREPDRLRTRSAAVVAALLAACGGATTGDGVPEHRLLVVGWDGATFDLVDPLLAAGRLPNLARLLEEGRAATLESTAVPISSAAWPVIATGKEPGETGIYSFFAPREDGEGVALVDARDNRAAPIWRTLSARGLPVLVWGVPMTWPPEPVRGTLVAGMLSPLDAAYTSPPELADELREQGFVPDLGIWREAQELTPERIAEQLALKERLLVERLERPDWALAFVVFKNLDVLSHRAYDGRLDGPVAALVEDLDATLGRLVAAAGEDTNVVVLSDHGFATYRKAFNLDAWLREEGFARRREGAPVPAPPAGPLATARAEEHDERVAQLDLARTQVLAGVAEGNFGSLRVNLAGRERHGSVAPDERDALLDRVAARLATVEHPSGVPVVRRVLRGDELYPGPERERVVPDLVVELDPSWRAVASSWAPVFQTSPRAFPDHARDGILVAAGPALAAGGDARPRLPLRDVAPLCLHLLDQPIPSGLRGDAHADWHRSPFAVVRVPEERDPSVLATETVYAGDVAPVDSEEVRRRLQGLGYTE